MSEMPKATIRYQQVVMWKKPGGYHHVTFLKKGDVVQILLGWRYDERTWKDKRYVKVAKGEHVGYVLAEALTQSKVKIDKFDYKSDLYEEEEKDGMEVYTE